MKSAPALTVIDGGRALESVRSAHPSSHHQVLELARALARQHHQAMMKAMSTDSQTQRLTIATSVEGAIVKR